MPPTGVVSGSALAVEAQLGTLAQAGCSSTPIFMLGRSCLEGVLRDNPPGSLKSSLAASSFLS